ncbi:LacI family DNA-binding transcriptional regulator [Amphibacillus sediminis]|uniref:LacI family DNA-binding transcriptional regulator n=1 Tax=Amphibacillus sediminis TaxID=360185 RepID=UPI0008340AFE|nr:LacI family DNA-binding transcriptional regulator [Amphibacillus sediminis]
MSITIKDIAKQAGVSYSTVSKALNNSPLVKDDTKTKIIEVAERLGYQPNYAAQRLVKKSTNIIGLIWPTIDRTVPARLVGLVRAALEQKGYAMILSVDPIEEAINMFKRFQVDGVILFEGTNYQLNTTFDIPMVSYGITHPNKTYPLIDANHRLAIEKAVKHLVDLGHQDIQFMGSLAKDDPFQLEKQQGFIDAITKYKLPTERCHLIDTKGLDWFDGYKAIASCLKSNNLPTAMISASYELSGGIIRCLAEHHIQIPKQLSLISYDNIPQMAHLEVPLTAVGISMDNLAASIVETLMLSLTTESSIPLTQKLNPELVIRKSCSKISQG